MRKASRKQNPVDFNHVEVPVGPREFIDGEF